MVKRWKPIENNITRKPIIIDSLDKYNKYTQERGSNLDSITMSSAMVKKYINETNFDDIDFEEFMWSQNINLELYLFILSKNMDNNFRSSIFYYYAGNNTITEEEFIQLLELIYQKSTTVAEPFSEYYCGNLCELIERNNISYEAVANGYKKCIDAWLKLPREFYEEKRTQPHSFHDNCWVTFVNNFICDIGSVIRRTFEFDGQDEDFIIDYLFGRKIMKSGIPELDRWYCSERYGSVHKSFFKYDRCEEITNLLLSSSTKFDFCNPSYNIYVFPAFYENVDAEITKELIEKIISKFKGKTVKQKILEGLFCSSVELTDDIISSYIESVSPAIAIKNESVCKWISEQNKTQDFLNKMMNGSDNCYYGYSVGYLSLTKKQILSTLKKISKNRSSLRLDYDNLSKISVSDMFKYKAHISLSLNQLENVNSLSDDMMLFFMENYYRVITNHKSLTNDNLLSSRHILNYINSCENKKNATNAIFNSIINNEKFEINDEIIKILITARHDRHDIIFFLEKLDKTMDNLINLFKEVI